MERISDVLSIVVIAVCAFKGYRRGFYKALFSVAALLGGYVAAHMCAERSGEVLVAHQVVPEMFSRMAGGMGVFFGVQLVCMLLAGLAERYLKPKGEKGVVALSLRAGGVAVGLCSGTLYALLISLGVLLLRSGQAAALAKEFTPSQTESLAARATAAVLERAFPDPKKTDYPAVTALYSVVSDPRRGMVGLKERLQEQISRSTGSGVSGMGGPVDGSQLQKALESPEFKKVLESPELKKALEDPQMRKLQQKFD